MMKIITKIMTMMMLLFMMMIVITASNRYCGEL